jgi:hypothetical protein
MLLSCKDHAARGVVFNDFNDLQIEINSPASCYNEIKMNDSGTGISIVGNRSIGQKEKIRNQKPFDIVAVDDRENISNIIEKITKRAPVSSSVGLDLYHYCLLIDGKKFVDVYGGDTLLDKLLVTLAPFARVEQTGQCDFFQLFQK